MAISLKVSDFHEFSMAAGVRRTTYVLIYDREDKNKSYSMKSAIGLNSEIIDSFFKHMMCKISRERMKGLKAGRSYSFMAEAYSGNVKVVDSQWIMAMTQISSEQK